MDAARNTGLPMDSHALDSLNGRRVLVTGAGGSIGSQLCHIIAQRAEKLILVSISESALYKVQQLLKDTPAEKFYVLADFGDSIAMNSLLDQVDLVIHAGAHKHVTLCEGNPRAAILNNVWGTQKLLAASHAAGVRQFIQISTDKAVEPASIMGATKRVCELLCTRREYTGMLVSVVRFGNVIDSDGSVIPLWRKQIAAGGPLTITSRECTRYFMTIPDACRLVLSVVHMGKHGIFVLDMGEPIKMIDIAQRMIVNSGQQIEIQDIGLRPGEKVNEELVHGGMLVDTKHPLIKQVVEQGILQPSIAYVPDMVEHARKNRPAEAIEMLWRVVHEAVRPEKERR